MDKKKVFASMSYVENQNKWFFISEKSQLTI